MERLKKILGIEISEKWLAVLAVLGMIGLMLPIFRLGLYAVPYYDDYMHLSFPKSFFAEYGGLSGWFQGVLYAVKSQYHAWQGTYSTQFIVSASPLFLDDDYYAYAVIAVLLLFIVAVMAAVLLFCDKLLSMDRSGRWVTAVVVTTALIELICTAQQGIYWYNGEVHYTLMHGLMLLMLAVAVCVIMSKTTAGTVINTVLTALLGIVVAGSNYVTILQGMLLLLTIIGLGILMKKRKTLWLLIPLVCYTAGFIINVTAPGNDYRGSFFEGFGPVKSVLYSFKSAGEMFPFFAGWITIPVMLLTVPVFWNTVKKMNFDFKLPGLVTLYSVCLYATGFTSSYYAMGSAGVDRTWVVIKFTLQLLLFVNEIYWLGFIAKRRERKAENRTMPHYVLYYAAIGVLALFIVFTTDNKDGKYLTYGAYQCTHVAQAQTFKAEYDARIEQIESGGPVVELAPYICKPYFLCIDDLSTDRYAQKNMSIAKWYGKEAVYITE